MHFAQIFDKSKLLEVRLHPPEWDSSAMKCEMYFPLECNQSANFALPS